MEKRKEKNWWQGLWQMNSFFVVSVFGFGFLILSNTISDRIGKGDQSNKISNAQIYKRRLHSSLLQVILECDENQCQVISFGNLLLSVVFTITNIFSRGVNAFDPMCNLQL